MRGGRHVVALATLFAQLACVPASYGEIAADAAARDGASSCPFFSPCLEPGLAFEGSLPSAHALTSVATGGRERITVLDVTSNGAFVGDRGTTRPFGASSTGPSTLRVEDVAPPELTLVGVRPGAAHLRILEPATGTLIDTIEVRVEDVVETRLTSIASMLVAPGVSIMEVASGGTLDFAPELVGTSGGRVWDDTLTVSGPRVAPASGAITLAVHRDATGDAHFTMPVVSRATQVMVAVGSLAFLWGLPDETRTLVDASDVVSLDLVTGPGAGQAMCVVPMDGPMVVGGSTPVITSDDGTLVTSSPVVPGCFLLSYFGAGGTTRTDVHVEVLGVTRTLHFVVELPPTEGALVSAPVTPRRAATRGLLYAR